MTGPARDSTGKGKGKAKPKDDSVGSMSRPVAETTPRSDREESSLGANSANSGVGGAMAAKALEVAKLCCSEPVEVPQRKTLLVLAMVVAVLAVFRSLLLPVSCCSPARWTRYSNQRNRTYSSVTSNANVYRTR